MRLRDTRHHKMTPSSANWCDSCPHGSSFNISSSHFCLELCHVLLLSQITFQQRASSFPVPLRTDGECEKQRPCCISEGYRTHRLPPRPSGYWALRGHISTFGFLIMSDHQRWRLKPKEEQWINISSQQLSQLIQCRSMAWRFRYDLWVRAVLIWCLWCTSLLCCLFLLVQPKLTHFFFLSWQGLKRKKKRLFFAHFVIESLFCLF